MRNKIVMITAALAVMMALTGIAAAMPATVDIDPSTDANPLYHPLDGTTVSYPTEFGDMESGIRRVTVRNVDLNSITLYDAGTGLSITATAGQIITQTGWNPSIAPSKIVTLDVTTNNAGRVVITTCLEDGSNCNPDSSTDFGSGSNKFEVPEFATVAIPIAAVLGLVFIFQQRKNKKE